MDNWEIFDETSLPNKEAFYCDLNMKDITDADYRHANKVFKEFKLKRLREYHNLYVQSDTLLFANAFENFRNMCMKVNELDPAYFVTARGLAWQACLKKTKVKLKSLTDIDMLLMVEKGIRGGICQAVRRCAKENNKYMKNYDKDKKSIYLMYLDENNLYGWAMSQDLPVDGFKWVEDLSKNYEDFIKNYDENSNIGYYFNVDAEYPKELHELHSNLPFLPERMKVNKYNKLICNQYDKKKLCCSYKIFKTSANHGLKLKKVHKVLQFNQKTWLKSYIDMNIEAKRQRTILKKTFLSL